MSAKTDTSKPTDAETIATLTASCTQLETALNQEREECRKARLVASEAAFVLQGIVRVIAPGHEDAGNAQASSDWLSLIEAAASHAFHLLTNSNIDEEMRGRA